MAGGGESERHHADVVAVEENLGELGGVAVVVAGSACQCGGGSISQRQSSQLGDILEHHVCLGVSSMQGRRVGQYLLT